MALEKLKGVVEDHRLALQQARILRRVREALSIVAFQRPFLNSSQMTDLLEIALPKQEVWKNQYHCM